MAASANTDVKDHLLHFLKSNGFIIQGVDKDDRVITHTKMDGGKYSIPPEAMPEFYRAYGMNLLNKKTLCYIEKNTPVFVLHFDIDFHSLFDEARTMAFCTVLCDAVNEYFTTPKTAIVCAILDEAGERKGPGLHILFPRAFVDTEAACAVWAGVVARCEEKLPWGTEVWGTTIDVAVLREKGSLRMVGSDKSERCPKCLNGHEKKCCEYCEGKGNILLGKVYWPWRMLPENDKTKEELQNMRANQGHAAHRCTIQSTRDKCSDDFYLPEGAPTPFKRKTKRSSDFVRGDENARFPRKGNPERIMLATEQLDALTQAIRNYDANFSQLVIRDVARCTGRDRRCWIRVRGFNDRFCLNKCALHSSNQIYFELSTGGLCQRCFSTKADVRDGGYKCSEFQGPLRQVPPGVAAVLGTFEEPTLPPPTAAAAKRRKANSSELVCYGGYYQVTPDASF